MKKYLETLPLTINKKWFDQIEAGTKKEEYREVKNYWIKRLTNQNDDGSVNGNSFYKHFRFVRFQNGYSKNARWMLVEFKGIEMKEIEHEHFHDGKIDVFAIKLGNIVSASERNDGKLLYVINQHHTLTNKAFQT
jgi:hypothetical protein